MGRVRRVEDLRLALGLLLAHVQGEQATFAPVVVDLIENQRAPPGFGTGTAAVKVPHLPAGESVGDPVITQRPEGSVHVRRIGWVHRQPDVLVLGDGHQLAVNREEPFPPVVELALRRRRHRILGNIYTHKV